MKNKKKDDRVIKTLLTIVATAIITVVVTTIYIYSVEYNNVGSVIGNSAKDAALDAKLSIIKDKIDDKYIGEVNESELIEGAIKGYVAGLNDVYTEYFPKSDMEDYMDETKGEYVGIGVYITKDEKNNQILIYGTMENSPAKEAGLQTGDILVSVNDEECDGDDYETITTKIKGDDGTKVKLGVIRNNENLTIEVKRKKIEVQHVTSQILEENIGYIYLSSFEGNGAKQFEEAYDNLNSKGIKSLIIDVRNNGGGIVKEALNIADFMTKKGETLLIEEDKNGAEVVEKAKKDKKITMPIVLLVNEYSASASEILAGILKEKVDNATIVGNTTYGKGVIQTLYTLTDGSGLKITTNEYFTPEHNKINKVGIEPDEKVTDYLYKGTLELDKDTQLKKAIEILKTK